MRIEESYLSVSGFFDLWVRLIELRTRKMEVKDSKIQDSRILIISPPTDRGIKILSQENQRGESYLLCFSDTLGKIAKEYSLRHGIENLEICVKPFFSVPFDDNYFDVVFANCFFDFFQESRFNDVIEEIKRTLKPRGLLFSVYMDIPRDLIGRMWASFFSRFPSLSQGCRPVDIVPFLSRWDFELKRDLTIKRLGFPIRYLIAEK